MKKTAARGVLLFSSALIMSIVYTNCSGGFNSLETSVGSTSSTGSGDGSGSGSGSGGTTTTPLVLSGSNIMAVTVGCGYVNEPCVTVTICQPGTSNCQTIPNVLLDTGSYGLRLFSQVSMDNFNSVTSLLSLTRTQDPSNSSNDLAECVSYADGSSDWGPVANADIVLGGELASGVPIQIIDSSFGTLPSDCTSPDTTPIGSNGTGFNGILGVGLFTDDCGPGCAPSTGSASNGIYYSCPSSGSGTCAGAAVAEAKQVTNPVSYLATDNNGVVLVLPGVASTFGLTDGVTSLNGSLYLGIGTQANNTPSGTTTLQADENGNFVTTFNGVKSTSSFIDSGSNALYFTGPTSLKKCTDDTSFYCPTSETTLSATQGGSNGVGSKAVSFAIGNADDEFSQSNPNVIFADLGGVMSSDFDWGLPFFFGRSIYVGIDSRSSTLGTGPLWAW